MPSSRKACFRFKEKPDPVEFQVIKTDNRPYPLIGLDTCLSTGMINVDDEINAAAV